MQIFTILSFFVINTFSYLKYKSLSVKKIIQSFRPLKFKNGNLTGSPLQTDFIFINWQGNSGTEKKPKEVRI